MAARALVSARTGRGRPALLAALLTLAGLIGLALLTLALWNAERGTPLQIALIWLSLIVGATGILRSAISLPPRLAAWLPAALLLLLGVLASETFLRAYAVPPGLIPTPSRVLSALWSARVVLLSDAFTTFVLEALTGYVVGSVLGVLLALAVARSPFLERGLLPYATAFSAIPIVALAPVLVKGIGLEWPSKAVIVAITVFFPVAVNVVRGLQSASPLALDLMRSYAATPGQTFAYLRVPASLPFLFNALKLSTTLALIGAIVGEFFGATGSGLGFRIQIEAGRFGFDIVWAAVIVAAILGIGFYLLVAWVEKWLTGWHVSYRS